MSFRVEWSPGALRDLHRLAKFLTDVSPSSALPASNLIVEAAEGLSNYPNRGNPGPNKGLRQLFVPFGDSAYVIRNRVRRHKVVIVSVFHGRERR